MGTGTEVDTMKRFVDNWRDTDIFGKIEWIAVKIGATLVFLVFVGVEVFHAITKLLGR
jgi:hypothetical protein